MQKDIARRIHVCEDNIGLDGIKYRGRGPIYTKYGFWYREPGNEEYLWLHSNFRQLELTKDLNDDEVWDIRAETGLKNHCANPVIGNRWYRCLMTLEYLLNRSLAYGYIPDFNRITDEKLIESFNSSVTARINCKKTAGGGTCPRSILNYHIEAYGDIIRQQIIDLNPNVIYIGGCDGNLILNKVVRPIFEDLQVAEPSGWLYYSLTKQTLIINGYNPGMRRSLEKVYNELAEALICFVQNVHYHSFIKAHSLQCLRH